MEATTQAPSRGASNSLFDLIERMEAEAVRVHQLEATLHNTRSAAASLQARIDEMSIQLTARAAELERAGAELERERGLRADSGQRLSAALKELEAARAKSDAAVRELALFKKAHAELADELAIQSRNSAQEREHLKKQAESLIARIRAEAEGRQAAAERGARESIARQTERAEGALKALQARLAALENEKLQFHAREQSLHDRLRQESERAAGAAARLTQCAREWESARAALLAEARALRLSRDEAIRVLEERITESRSREESAIEDRNRLEALLRSERALAAARLAELERVRRTYPLKDLLREKESQIEALQSTEASLPPEQKERVSRLRSLLRQQSEELRRSIADESPAERAHAEDPERALERVHDQIQGGIPPSLR